MAKIWNLYFSKPQRFEICWMVTLLSYSISGICKLSLPFVTKELQDYSQILLQLNLQLTSFCYRTKVKCWGIEVEYIEYYSVGICLWRGRFILLRFFSQSSYRRPYSVQQYIIVSVHRGVRFFSNCCKITKSPHTEMWQYLKMTNCFLYEGDV